MVCLPVVWVEPLWRRWGYLELPHKIVDGFPTVMTDTGMIGKALSRLVYR